MAQVWSVRRVVSDEGCAEQGIWAGKFQVPAEWRKAGKAPGGVQTSDGLNSVQVVPVSAAASKTPAAPMTGPGYTPPDPKCAIKGNIGSSGSKIYHVPGGAFYDRTNIDTAAGERWFCSAKDAEAAGWRGVK